MTKQDIASLALKLMGIFCFIRAIEHLHIFLNTLAPVFYNESMPAVYVLGSLFTLVGLLLAGILLIMLSPRLSHYCVGPSTGGNITTNLTIEDIQRVAFSIIGVVFMAMALTRLHLIFIQLYQIYQIPADYPSLDKYYEALFCDGIIFLVKFGLGFYLFFLGNGLVKLWYKFQPMRDKS